MVRFQRSRNPSFRIITISSDKMAIFITHEKIKNGNAAASKVASKLPVPMFTMSKGFTIAKSKSMSDRYIRHIDVSDLDGWQTGVIGTITLENAKARNPKLNWDRLVSKTVTIFHHGHKTLDFIIENDNHRNSLIKAMQEIRQRYHVNEQIIANDALLLRHVWYDIDTDKDSMISEKEFLKLCDRINLQTKDLKTKFRGFLKSNNINRKDLFYGECKALLQSIKSEMSASLTEEVLSKVFGDSYKQGVSSSELLQKFLRGAQGEVNATVDNAKELISILETMDMDTVKTKKTSDMLTDFDAFEEYLLSDANNAYDTRARNEIPKLDRPMSHYWINTSHNTYLTGTACNLRRPKAVYEFYLKH